MGDDWEEMSEHSQNRTRVPSHTHSTTTARSGSHLLLNVIYHGWSHGAQATSATRELVGTLLAGVVYANENPLVWHHDGFSVNQFCAWCAQLFIPVSTM
jgi:hypothetical protein